jgi:site-specific DNA-methyltransferase (adenine-specific)
MIAPYYDEDGITIYLGDCLDILPHITADVIVTDPPYGINLDTDYSALKGTGRFADDVGGKKHPRVVGDDQPFDPTPFLKWPAAMFGANHWAQRVPDGSTWHIWDKREELGSNMLADAEMWVTTWGSGPTRIFRHKWLGYFRPAGRTGDGYWHPTSKPLALMRHIIGEKRTPPGVILDPFMGSGTTLRAAKDLGRRAIGIEIEERYCEIAVKRLAQGVLPL